MENKSFVLAPPQVLNIARLAAQNQMLTSSTKIEGVLQELDETQYWLELIAETNLVKPERLAALQEETEELIAMFVTIVKGVKEKQKMLKKKSIIPHPSALIP